MGKEIKRYVKMLVGFVFCAFGIVAILNSHLGLSPWDVLNQGLNVRFGITLGQANTIVGIIVIALGLYFKQPLGVGTILNVILVGIFIDMFIHYDLIPTSDVFYQQVIIFLVGMFVFSLGAAMYITAGLGCGPRDGLMVVFTKKTGYSVAIIRFCMECMAMTTGYFLGGKVFIGTALFSLTAGYVLQFYFKMFKVDVRDIVHRSVFTEVKLLAAFIGRGFVKLAHCFRKKKRVCC